MEQRAANWQREEAMLRVFFMLVAMVLLAIRARAQSRRQLNAPTGGPGQTSASATVPDLPGADLSSAARGLPDALLFSTVPDLPDAGPSCAGRMLPGGNFATGTLRDDPCATALSSDDLRSIILGLLRALDEAARRLITMLNPVESAIHPASLAPVSGAIHQCTLPAARLDSS